MNIKILDCTLRDGGYVNSFIFSNSQIINIIKNLQNAKIDIIECGFLDSLKGKTENFTRFKSINFINDLLLNVTNTDSMKVAMIEYGKYTIDELPIINTIDGRKIEGIRFSFRKSDHLDIFSDLEKIVKKGYKLFIQPIATETYNDDELIDFIKKCNFLKPAAIYIVDTHGSMYRDDFRRLYYLFDKNLDNSIALGFHSHNNMQLSYSNAIDFIEISSFSKRDIIIDSSVYGMGRGAGNLNTELLADYINKRIQDKYKIDNILEIVDKYLMSLKRKFTWGYSLEHFLSATQKCHPNYASFLINKKNLSIGEIKQLLSVIPVYEKREFNKVLMEDIYIKHKENYNLKVNNLPFDFFRKKLLLLASGQSIKKNTEKLKSKILRNNAIVISLNHINPHIESDYIFFSNQVRYDEFCDLIDNPFKLIVTSNIKIKSNHLSCYMLDYQELYFANNTKADNVAILFMNYLVINNVQEIFIAGLDGYSTNILDNYSYKEDTQIVDKNAIVALNKQLSHSIEIISNKLHISFVTPSIFRKFSKQKVIGVIPARYNSSRLPGKPLYDIEGLPMIIHVLKRAEMSKLIDELYVATDDQRIYDEVIKYNGKAIMTSKKHNNGTERLCEIADEIIGDIYTLINGDEPLINPVHIDQGIKGLLDNEAPVSLLYNKYYKYNSPSDFKVVLNRKNEIMYISRSDIPSSSRNKLDYIYKAYHVMTYTKDFLEIYSKLDETSLDKIESHELLRVLEYGYKIQGIEVDSSAISVDTQDDLKFVLDEIKKDKLFYEYKSKK